MDNEQQTCINPWEDQIEAALKHYEEISSQACSWSSIVPAALRAYKQPTTPTREEQFYTAIRERQSTSNIVASAAYELALRDFLKIFKLEDNVTNKKRDKD